MKNTTKQITETLNAKLIFDYIEKENLTQREFCNQCKISISTFYKIINGKDFNLISLFKIARTINVPIHLFFK